MALVLAMLGRVEEAVSTLRQRELAKPWRLGKLYLTSLRALLEGNREESLATSEELMKATFRDPEGMYYLARQLSYLHEEGPALDMLSAPSTMDSSVIRRWYMTLGSMPCACALNSLIYCEKLISCNAKLRAPFSLPAAPDLWESARKATKAGPLPGARRGSALSSRAELPWPDVVNGE